MSNYFKIARRPYGDKSWDLAYYMDDFFDKHQYGVQFSDGTVLTPDKITETLDTIPDAFGLIVRAYNSHPAFAARKCKEL